MEVERVSILGRDLHVLADLRRPDDSSIGRVHDEIRIRRRPEIFMAVPEALHDPGRRGGGEDRLVVGLPARAEDSDHRHPERVRPGEIEELAWFGQDLVAHLQPGSRRHRRPEDGLAGDHEGPPRFTGQSSETQIVGIGADQRRPLGPIPQNKWIDRGESLLDRRRQGPHRERRAGRAPEVQRRQDQIDRGPLGTGDQGRLRRSTSQIPFADVDHSIDGDRKHHDQKESRHQQDGSTTMVGEMPAREKCRIPQEPHRVTSRSPVAPEIDSSSTTRSKAPSRS